MRRKSSKCYYCGSKSHVEGCPALASALSEIKTIYASCNDFCQKSGFGLGCIVSVGKPDGSDFMAFVTKIEDEHVWRWENFPVEVTFMNGANAAAKIRHPHFRLLSFGDNLFIREIISPAEKPWSYDMTRQAGLLEKAKQFVRSK